MSAFIRTDNLGSWRKKEDTFQARIRIYKKEEEEIKTLTQQMGT